MRSHAGFNIPFLLFQDPFQYESILSKSLTFSTLYCIDSASYRGRRRVTSTPAIMERILTQWRDWKLQDHLVTALSLVHPCPSGIPPHSPPSEHSTLSGHGSARQGPHLRYVAFAPGDTLATFSLSLHCHQPTL